MVDTPAPTTAAACGSGGFRGHGWRVAAVANLGHASSAAMASGVAAPDRTEVATAKESMQVLPASGGRALEVRRQPQLPVSAMAEVEAGVKDRCVFRDSLVN